MTWRELREYGTGGLYSLRCASCRERIAYGDCSHIPFMGSSASNIFIFADGVEACECPCGEYIVTPVSSLSARREARRATDEEVRAIIAQRHASELADGQSICGQCLNTFDGPLTTVFDRYDRETHVCSRCVSWGYRQCAICERRRYHYSISSGAFTDGIYRDVCHTCQQGLDMCSHCSTFRFDDDAPECCEEDEDEIVPGCRCDECDDSIRRYVHNYSYKPMPEFRFIGDERRMGVNRYNEPTDRTPYLGFELELEVPSGVDRARSARKVIRTLGDVVYLKEDGSIDNGFEVVTHPMTLDYAMSQFNWAGIRELRRERMIMTGDNCGLHIHVSKAGFSGPAHEYRWLVFWHRNQVALKKLAGRDSSYATYDISHRSQFKNIVENKPANAPRYSAINTTNEYTHEVRVFASTVYVNRLKAALQLVESTVEYTRSLAAAKVLKDGGFSWSEYESWLRQSPARYAQLIKRIDDLFRGREHERTVQSFDFYEYPQRRGYRDRYESPTLVTKSVVVMEGKRS